MHNFFTLFWNRPGLFLDVDEKAGGTAPDADVKAKQAEDEKAKQDALNQQFAERAQRAADAERKKLLESLGVSSAEEATALLKIAREADEKTKTEAEKLQAQLTAAEQARVKAETAAQEKEAAATKRLMDSEIKINASVALTEKGKLLRPAFRRDALDDVLLLIDRNLIKEEEGVFKNIDKALEALAKAKPYLLEEKQPITHGTPRDGITKRQTEDAQPRTPIISSL